MNYGYGEHGNGYIAKDFVSKVPLRFPKTLNSLGFWRFSDNYVGLRKPMSGFETSGLQIVYNTTLNMIIDERCATLIYNKEMKNKCGEYIGIAMVDFYYLSCVRSGYSAGNVEAIYIATISYI